MALAWRQSSIVHQVHPRSFQDSDGDGTGDWPGITSRLGLLLWLGVDALWISPVYPSPMTDFGYDVADHCGIDPLFGMLDDFDALLAQVCRLGLKVILDFCRTTPPTGTRGSRTAGPARMASGTGTYGGTRRPAAGRRTSG